MFSLRFVDLFDLKASLISSKSYILSCHKILGVRELIYNNKKGLVKAFCKLTFGLAHILILTIVKKALFSLVSFLLRICLEVRKVVS